MDNSPSVWFARSRTLANFILLGTFLPIHQRNFISVALAERVRFASATKLPFPDASVEVIYSSHMLEHLPRHAAPWFLQEARRILIPEGTIRLVLPDLRSLVVSYLHDGDADAFLEKTFLVPDRAIALKYRLLSALWGERHHQWMYDGASLVKLLSAHGFQNPQVLEAGKTTIADPGPLDLEERKNESVYIEARR